MNYKVKVDVPERISNHGYMCGTERHVVNSELVYYVDINHIGSVLYL